MTALERIFADHTALARRVSAALPKHLTETEAAALRQTGARAEASILEQSAAMFFGAGKAGFPTEGPIRQGTELPARAAEGFALPGAAPFSDAAGGYTLPNMRQASPELPLRALAEELSRLLERDAGRYTPEE